LTRARDVANASTKVLTTSKINSDQTLSPYYRYLVDTSVARTLTLPASSAIGDEIQIIDEFGNAAINNITLARNSQLINGSAVNLIIDTAGARLSLVYTGSTYGWRAS